MEARREVIASLEGARIRIDEGTCPWTNITLVTTVG